MKEVLTLKTQWGLIFALIFALIIGVFSVVNVNDVTVDYVFGTAEWPLVLVILVSVLMGAILIGLIGLVRIFRLQRDVRRLRKENNRYKETLALYEEQDAKQKAEENHETTANDDLANQKNDEGLDKEKQ